MWLLAVHSPYALCLLRDVMPQRNDPTPAPGSTRRAATLSFGIAAFVAFVAASFVAANTMVLTAQHAGLCKEGEAELSVDKRTRAVDKDGVTVHCVKRTNSGKKVKRDVGAAALFIGWGVWMAVIFVVLWPVLFFGLRTVLRRRRFAPSRSTRVS
jgi:hypothetical protein